MSNFTLTTSPDNFTGTSGSDVFAGPGGGVDALDGAGGIDEFHIDSSQIGTIDGGAGVDTLFATENELNAGLSFSNLEVLNASTTNIFATAAQLAEFHSIVPGAGGTDFFAFLQGAGGTVDFSTKFVSPLTLNVEASLTTSGVVLTGTSHGDSILGSNFNDRLTGGGGNDSINGGGGDDVIWGGTGHNTLDGASGNDTVNYSDVATGVTVNLTAGWTTGTSISDTLANFENVTGSGFNDRLFGNGNANTINGGAGDDFIRGQGGADLLTGGLGADTFEYDGLGESTVAPAGRDWILDFSSAQGDKINVNVIDANNTVAGNQDFTFIGANAFSHTAGELHYQASGGSLVLSGDVNGDATADFSVVVKNVVSLSAGDLIL